MFERNRVDNNLQTSAVAAEITLADGETVKGRFIISAARSLQDILNGEAQFLDFETYGGDRALIAKSTLRAVKILAVPNAGSLKAKARDSGTFDPHGVLGIERGASWEEVRRAYLALSKIYHPDRYAGIELPKEVRDYFDAMIGRINAAYTALEETQVAAKEGGASRAKPIFTSPQRF